MSVGRVILAVLSEAKLKFGPVTPANSHEVTQWVQARVRDVLAKQASGPRPYEPAGFPDVKVRQGGES